MIEGISHITFIVKDLKKTAHFFQSIFDAEEVYDSGKKTYSLSKEKFFLINGIWIAIMEGDPIIEKSYNHVAFKVTSVDFQKYVERVKKMGVEMKEPRNRVEGEGDSLYFYDYDNHLFEIHTGNLADRLKKYKENS